MCREGRKQEGGEGGGELKIVLNKSDGDEERGGDG